MNEVRYARFLSLRWRAFIALAVTLLISNAVIALVTFRDASGQFEQRQARHREQTARLLADLLRNNDPELAGIVDLLPTLAAGDDDKVEFASALSRALDRAGSLLAVNWDVASVHWLDAAGSQVLRWPESARPLPPGLARTLREGEQRVRQPELTLACPASCFQYLAVPVLWQGDPRGLLVLERTVADALLTFRSLTGADVALLDTAFPDAATYGFPAITSSGASERVIEALAAPLLAAPAALPDPVSGTAMAGRTTTGRVGDAWYEVYRVDGLAEGVAAVVIDDITEARLAIRDATRNSILLGIGALLLSGAALLGLTQMTLSRLSRVTRNLPLIAEGRYRELVSRLPTRLARGDARDELDQLGSAARELAERMERIEGDRQEAMMRSAWLARHDTLTHLSNRSRFIEDLGTALSRSERLQQQGALILLDLDRFSDLNDLSGYRIGDRALVGIAERLRELVPQGDSLARLSGDTFAVLLSSSSQGAAIIAAERFQNAISNLRLADGDHRHHLSACAGLALFPDNGAGAEELLTRADLALHQAKSRGPGSCHCFSLEDLSRSEISERTGWRHRIADALAEDRFVLHYQPVVSVATGVLAHCEALVRMVDVDGAVVAPHRFIPVAEQTGQIAAIDRWVVTAAIRALTEAPALSLSVNLSGHAISSSSILDEVPEMLRQADVAAGRLMLEITETAAILSLGAAGELMTRFGAQGHRFALDDFGSGYASYAYLRRLPVHQVKIDGAFVRGLADSEDDRAFVRSICDMAHNMGKEVVAEFVANAEIFRIIADIGVDYAQGHYLGKAAPEPEYGPWTLPWS